MTKSKTLKILNKYDSQLVLIYMYDYYKLELDKLKSHIEKNGGFSFDKKDYIVKTIKIVDLIASVETKIISNDNVQFDENIRYNEDNASIFEIVRNIDKYLKKTPIIAYNVSSSKKEYDNYYAEHKEIIRQRTNALINLYGQYINNLK